MDIFTALFADLLIKLLLGLLIMQSLGFFWFVWVIIRFGLLRRDEPEKTQEENYEQTIQAHHF